ncbi:hypothetical protein NUKP38_51680 [Klebsiella variicola]|jgi:hypothetical protein|nr:hypothetical protein NUKP38_51680 [Klebsiella variicola]
MVISETSSDLGTKLVCETHAEFHDDHLSTLLGSEYLINLTFKCPVSTTRTSPKYIRVVYAKLLVYSAEDRDLMFDA